jgi:hypothetical protein
MVFGQADAVDVSRLQEGHVLDIGHVLGIRMEMQQFSEQTSGLTGV